MYFKSNKVLLLYSQYLLSLSSYLTFSVLFIYVQTSTQVIFLLPKRHYLLFPLKQDAGNQHFDYLKLYLFHLILERYFCCIQNSNLTVILFQCFKNIILLSLASIASGEKSAENLMFALLKTKCLFSLATFKISSLNLVFSSFTLFYVKVQLSCCLSCLDFIWASLICGLFHF